MSFQYSTVLSEMEGIYAKGRVCGIPPDNEKCYSLEPGMCDDNKITSFFLLFPPPPSHFPQPRWTLPMRFISQKMYPKSTHHQHIAIIIIIIFAAVIMIMIIIIITISVSVTLYLYIILNDL